MIKITLEAETIEEIAGLFKSNVQPEKLEKTILKDNNLMNMTDVCKYLEIDNIQFQKLISEYILTPYFTNTGSIYFIKSDVINLKKE